MSESIESVLWKLGIKYNTGILDCEVEQQILDLIELKRPVIMHVDCFYLPYCNKYYTKEHCDHVLTIIDYDSEKKSFCVVDQKNLDSVSFSLLTIDESLLYSSVKVIYIYSPMQMHLQIESFLTELCIYFLELLMKSMV